VFFGTDQGIISIMGDATESNVSFTDVHAYPNPVRENYIGVISIVGLVDKSNVKITDVAGNLIYETTSNGGMATWDGTNSAGNRVSTGVYFAICSSPDAKKSSICKILIINK
jgi:flagellar hook assembly protein FlgD